MSPILNAALPKMGLNRNFLRAVVHSPKMFQGLAIPHIFTMQNIQHIVNIINHQLNPDLTTDFHCATFESVYLFTGVGPKFFYDTPARN